MSTRSASLFRVAIPMLLTLAACDAEDPTAVQAPPVPRLAALAASPQLPPAADFVDPTVAPNPYFPLLPGTVWTYEAESDEGLEMTVDSVSEETRTILGIEATIVVDRVYLDGELIELTYDWYGQDAAGNVWYLGEDACEFDVPGGPCIPSGSWEAGVDGAEAGIIMWADPLAHKGKTYRQEYYEGEAEDVAKVLHGGLTVDVPAGSFADCIETMDFTPLDPGARAEKFYCADVGLALEVQMRGGRIRDELVSLDAPM